MIFYVSFMVIKNTPEKKRKEYKHTTTENHLITKGEAKKKERNCKTARSNEQRGINTYVSIVNLNLNELNSPIKRHRVPKWIPK